MGSQTVCIQRRRAGRTLKHDAEPLRPRAKVTVNGMFRAAARFCSLRKAMPAVMARTGIRPTRGQGGRCANHLGSESERARYLERLIWASTHVRPARDATPLPPSSPLRNREGTKTADFPRRRQSRHHRRDTLPNEKATRVLTQNTSVTTTHSAHLKASHPTLPRVSNRTQRPRRELTRAGS